jgi:hypothetical protein
MKKCSSFGFIHFALVLVFAELFAAAQLGARPPLGVYEGPGSSGASLIPVFSSWFGRPPDRAIDFFANDSWSSLESDSAWDCLCWVNSATGVPAMTFSVPLTVNGTSLADVAAGLHDSSFLAVANSLVSSNWGSSVIRLGWEFNGSWMPWAAGNDPVGYVAAYRHVVSLMRSVPGANFTFDWCTSWGPNATAPDSVYPGDDVVDIVGMDVYNTYFSPADADPVHRWNTMLTAPYGLNWLASFSLAHGKPLSIPEWGTGECLINNGGTGGGDDPLFVTNMSNFIKSNAAAYSNYWDASASGYDSAVSDGEHPLAGAALMASFASVVAPKLLITAAPPGPILWVGAGNASTTTTVSIDFSPPYGGGAANSYTLLYRPSGTSTWTAYGSFSNVGTQTLGGLQPGTSYDMSVEAVNGGGAGPQSQAISLSTVSGTSAGAGAAIPGMIPWIGQGEASTSNSISINFAPPNDGGTPTGYVIMIRVTGQTSWQNYGTVGWTGWQTVGNLSPGTSYDTEVYATNASGSGLPSAVYTVSTL